MRKTMIIPTYWCRRTGELWREGDAVYDHPTPVDQEGTLERTLLSMKQFHEKDFKLVILICPTTPEVEEEAYGQVLRITRRAQLNAETYLFTAGDLREMTGVLRTAGLNDQGAKLLSMFGYIIYAALNIIGCRNALLQLCAEFAYKCAAFQSVAVTAAIQRNVTSDPSKERIQIASWLMRWNGVPRFHVSIVFTFFGCLLVIDYSTSQRAQATTIFFCGLFDCCFITQQI